MTTEELRAALAERDVLFVRKDHSRLMRFIGWILALTHINNTFMTDYFTVVGKRTVYYPVGCAYDLEKGVGIEHFLPTFEHELVHMRQRDKWGILWQISYLLFPLPFGLAWYRWRWEREAYLTNILNHGRDIDAVVDALWTYGWPWPKSWMKRWFEKAVAEKGSRL